MDAGTAYSSTDCKFASVKDGSVYFVDDKNCLRCFGCHDLAEAIKQDRLDGFDANIADKKQFTTSWLTDLSSGDEIITAASSSTLGVAIKGDMRYANVPGQKLYEIRYRGGLNCLTSADVITASCSLDGRVVTAATNLEEACIVYKLIIPKVDEKGNRILFQPGVRVKERLSVKYGRVRHIRMAKAAGRVVVVGTRCYQYVDVLQILDDKLQIFCNSSVGFDVCGTYSLGIYSIAQVGSETNFLLGGDGWMKVLHVNFK